MLKLSKTAVDLSYDAARATTQRRHQTSPSSPQREALTALLLVALSLAACGDTEASRAATDPNNIPPVAALDVPSRVLVEEPVMLDASASYDEDGEILRYLFEVNGPPFIQTNSPSLVYTFEETGEVNISLTVVDDQGTKETVRETITVTSR